MKRKGAGDEPRGQLLSRFATVQTQWQEGCVVEPVRATNTSSAAINAWTVTFTLPAGHSLTDSWNTTAAVSGQTVAARNASYNGTLQPNASTTFAVQVRRPNDDTQVPTAFAAPRPK